MIVQISKLSRFAYRLNGWPIEKHWTTNIDREVARRSNSFSRLCRFFTLISIDPRVSLNPIRTTDTIHGLTKETKNTGHQEPSNGINCSRKKVWTLSRDRREESSRIVPSSVCAKLSNSEIAQELYKRPAHLRNFWKSRQTRLSDRANRFAGTSWRLHYIKFVEISFDSVARVYFEASFEDGKKKRNDGIRGPRHLKRVIKEETASSNFNPEFYRFISVVSLSVPLCEKD